MVTPAGGKWWRLRYRYDDKDKLLSLGVYPDVSLKGARERRDQLRKQIEFLIRRLNSLFATFTITGNASVTGNVQ